MLRARSEGRGRKPREQGMGARDATAGSSLSSEATTGLLEAILGRDNMMAALRRVVTNKGAPGVDGMPVERLADHLKAQWRYIREDLLASSYRPAAVRGVEIPKPGGGTRGLGIPTALDHLIQQAMHQVLTPLFDPGFSEASYGFRPGRSAHDAVLAARAASIWDHLYLMLQDREGRDASPQAAIIDRQTMNSAGGPKPMLTKPPGGRPPQSQDRRL